MSLGINTTTPEGMVLAADSRQSYRNKKGISRIGSDSASKIFKLTPKVGIIVAGKAFLIENEIPKNISRFIEDFKDKNDFHNQTVQDISDKLKIFFEGKHDYKSQLEALPKQLEADLKRQGCEVLEILKKEDHLEFKFKDQKGQQIQGIAGVESLELIIAGYNSDDTHQVNIIHIPGKIEPKRDSSKKGMEYGACWIGQKDVLARLVLGFDGRIGNLPMIKKATSEIGPSQVEAQLRSLEYAIQWGTMTLQDGIDFSVLAIQTTAAIQRFSDGIRGDPGDMPGVGGPVDVAVITSDKGFVWISKKNLRVGDKEVDLELVEKNK